MPGKIRQTRILDVRKAWGRPRVIETRDGSVWTSRQKCSKERTIRGLDTCLFCISWWLLTNSFSSHYLLRGLRFRLPKSCIDTLTSLLSKKIIFDWTSQRFVSADKMHDMCNEITFFLPSFFSCSIFTSSVLQSYLVLLTPERFMRRLSNHYLKKTLGMCESVFKREDLIEQVNSTWCKRFI